MEEQLAHNQAVVSSLRSLLDRTEAQAFSIEHRSVPAMLGLAVSESVTGADLDAWWGAAFDALRAELRRAGATAAAPAGALYPAEFFQLDKAEVVAFIPVTEPITSGRSQTIEIPGADLAIAVHVGALGEIDQTYAALGRHVVLDAIGMAGPIREYYLVTADHTPDESRHRTEVCWPILPTSMS
jgi:effector-binding domain-containing protein